MDDHRTRIASNRDMTLLTDETAQDRSAQSGSSGDAGKRRRASALTASLLAHIAIVAALCWPATPVVLAPRLVARGEGGNAVGTSGTVLYLPSAVRAAKVSATQEHALHLPSPRPEQEKEAARLHAKRLNGLEVEHPSGTHQPGSPYGSSYGGLWSGDDIKPALPSVFPDLTIRRNELPAGVEGDVIVEVTIDAQGAVIEHRLLQGLGHGIDERVIAVLREWRFRPATKNGVPIPSKHDVHFHFPS